MSLIRKSEVSPGSVAVSQLGTIGLPLHIRLRPRDLNGVVGHVPVVNALRSLLASKSMPHSFLFTGPSGVGKTTLARILANHLGCAKAGGLIEIDAARFSGVDNMREIILGSNFVSLSENSRKLIVIDECFAEGTLISTPKGKVPIETIHPGDEVFSALGTARVKQIMKKRLPYSRVVKLRLSNGRAILCSREHLFLTSIGWVRAESLTFETKLINGRDKVPDSLLEVSDTFLDIWARSQILRAVSDKRVSSMQGKVCSAALQPASHLQPEVWESTCGNKKNRTTPTLLEASCCQRNVSVEEEKPRDVGFQSEGMLRKNDQKQSFPSKIRGKKDDGNESKERNASHLQWYTRGQRKTDEATESSSISLKMADRICNWFRQREVGSGVSDELQSRYCLPSTETGNRSRQPGPLLGESEKKGREERDEASGTWVVSVESFERGSRLKPSPCAGKNQEESFPSEFYDLEIEGHPSYLVEDFVVHNCHMLSKGAWNSLLLSIEEPPPHLWWVICTTEPEKVPQTIKTRCHSFDLKPLKWDEIAVYLEGVVKSERLKIADGVMEVLARRSMGSLRQALVYLSTVTGVVDKAEALKLIESVDSQEGSPIQLARMICIGRGFNWEAARALLQQMEDVAPESIRLVVVNYATTMLMDTKGGKEATRLMAVLQAFAGPYNSSERQAPLLLAVGTLLFGANDDFN